MFRRLMERARSTDWGLVALAAAFLLVLPLWSGADGTYSSGLRFVADRLASDPLVVYRRALSDLATAEQQHDKPLVTLDPKIAMTTLVTFSPGTPDAKNTLGYDIWGTTKPELQAACAQSKNVVQRVQEVLGLPPAAASNRMIYELSVPTGDLFRPCFSRAGTADASCGAKIARVDDTADAATLAAAYDDLAFNAEQLWKSARPGIAASPAKPPAAFAEGMPFTGMGWSYDWDPASTTHFGVTEFVVRKDADIKVIRSSTLEDFCKGGT